MPTEKTCCDKCKKDFYDGDKVHNNDCPCHSNSNIEEWSRSLSPSQEWKLHNGEVKVPVWFIRFCERIRATTQADIEERVLKQLLVNTHYIAQKAWENDWLNKDHWHDSDEFCATLQSHLTYRP